MAATVIPSVGCPVGCNFCSTSAMFGGKGHSVRFYETGDELFDIMCQLEANLKVQSFFMMDENFLLDRVRALRLLELMERHDKAWALYVFSSAGVLRSYSIEQLVRLGLTWVWLGLEGEDSRYTKLRGTDTRALVRRLQAHGTRVLGSTIIGLENHSPENIDARDRARRAPRHRLPPVHALHAAARHAALHAELSAQGRMKDESECQVADIHGQSVFNYRHPHIRDGLETELIVRAFQRDFEVNGPSVVRIARTMLAGWKRYKNHAGPARSPPLRLGSPRPAHRLLGRGGRGTALLPRQSDAAREDGRDPQGLAPRVRPEVAVLQRRGRAVRVLEDAPRGAATRTGLDLRAADVLRAERGRRSSWPSSPARRRRSAGP